MRRILLAFLPLVVACGGGAPAAAVTVCTSPVPLTAAEVTAILEQGAARATADGVPVVMTVVSRDGVVAGAFAMAGVPAGFVDSCRSKARTAALLSSSQLAFSTRTAEFIIQDHFPPDQPNTPGGPLYGVQFSQLPCSDVVGETGGTVTTLGNGLSGDFGSVPLYRAGCLVGAVGVDGGPSGDAEERIAWAAAQGFRPEEAIFGSRVLIDGIRFEFLEQFPDDIAVTVPYASLAGVEIVPPSAAPPDLAFPGTVLGGVPVEVRYPIADSPEIAPVKLLSADVTAVLAAAAARSQVTRAAIRLPIGAAAQVFVAVTDRLGNVVGCVRTPDATLFSFDVAVQKARTAAFFSTDSCAVTTRGLGFLAQGFFPPGIEDGGPGALNGLQAALSASCEPAAAGLPNGITVFPGGIPLYKGGVLVGGIGVSGDGVDQDDFIAAAGAGLLPPPAGARADELPEAAVVAALRARVAAIAAATLDPGILAATATADARLALGIQGLRLPYVKFPRQPS